MDLFLPREMLVQIAGHLSKKDFNSLALTNRTAAKTLKRYRKETRVDLVFESSGDLESYHEEYLQFEVHLKTAGGIRCFKSRLFEAITEEPPTEEEAKKREEDVASFYYRNRENPLNWHDAITHFYFNDALRVHFNFLRKNNVKIDNITMEYVEEEHQRKILASFPMTGLTVEEFYFNDGADILVDIDFIVACNPKVLILELPSAMLDCDNFYQLKAIRQLRKLTICFGDYIPPDNVLKEGDLPALSATHLQLSVLAAPLKDVKTFLNQWMKKKREFEFLDLVIQLDLPIPVIKAMISKLARRFVEVEEVRADEWILRRNDGQQLMFTLKEEQSTWIILRTV